jgi:hypothetical protein
MDIIRPLSSDGCLGYDQFNQLTAMTVDREYKTFHHVPDLRGHKCIVCAQGWALTAESFNDNQRIDDLGYSHKGCWQRFQTIQEYYDWRGILVGCGIRFCGLKEIPNEYTRGSWGPKWFKTQLFQKKPYLTIGRRKRVWEIVLYSANVTQEEFEQSCIGKTNNTKHLEDDNVLVHAYSFDEAKEFLKAMWGFCQKPGLIDETIEENR